MAPRHKLRSVAYKNIVEHHTQSLIERIWHERKGDTLSEQSAETEAMAKDWQEISRRRGARGQETLSSRSKAKTHDVDGLTDEQYARIAIRIEERDESPDDGPDDSPAKEESSADMKSSFDQYKHHQYVRRWGLLRDSNGIDEEWFLSSPTVLPETDSGYLCDMCRHIDWEVLFTRRGLPGNNDPAKMSLQLFGMSNIMRNEHCAFCRLLRRKILQDDILPADLSQDVLDGLHFKMTVRDNGPDYALGFDVEIAMPDDRSLNPSFVVQRLSPESESKSTIPLQGLSVSPLSANFDRLKRWLHDCREGHGEGKKDISLQGGDLPPKLRLIDVVDNCVKEVDIPCEYACLSYVWGTGTQAQLTAETRATMETVGSLMDAKLNLSQTIKDSLTVTQNTGIRYIWVDALCILQDNPQDKAAIISRMGSIYGNAVLTIVATTNTDPCQGLPGISTPRPQPQIVENVQGLTLAVAFHDVRKRYQAIEDAKWNRRAWTFQERLRSHRSVHFTDSQMCFMCDHGVAYEDTVTLPDKLLKLKPYNEFTDFSSWFHHVWARVWSDHAQRRYPNKAFKLEGGTIMTMLADHPDDPSKTAEDDAPIYITTAMASSDSMDRTLLVGGTLWDTYAQAVGAYTKRKMTWQTDAINAFVGIADLIRQGTNTKFWYGMPEFEFTRSLLWYPEAPLKRRTQDDKTLFPSWTWAAWEGHVSYRGRGWFNAISFRPANVIDWHQRITTDAMMDDFKATGERSQEEIEAYTERLRNASLLLERVNRGKLHHADYEQRGWELERDTERNRHFYTHAVYPGVRVDAPLSLPDESLAELPSDDGTLYFKARTTPAFFCDMAYVEPVQAPVEDMYFQLGLNDEKRSSNYRQPWKRIIYHQGYRAGFLVLNVPFDDLNLQRDSYSLAAVSRSSVPHIAPPAVGWDMYWMADPQMMQRKMIMDEVDPERDPPEKPNENVPPTLDSENENGDPQWDLDRFGNMSVYDVYDVLLLVKMEDGSSQRIGVGKVSQRAFHWAQPQPELIILR